MPRSRFTTYVIALPADAEARTRLLEALASTVADHRGQITAISLSDEISVCERLEEELPDWQVADIRREVEALPVPDIADQPTVGR
jgi:hypothetical protein